MRKSIAHSPLKLMLSCNVIWNAHCTETTAGMNTYNSCAIWHMMLCTSKTWNRYPHDSFECIWRSVASRCSAHTTGNTDAYGVLAQMQPTHNITGDPWWRHQMETFSALLAICAANSPVTGEFPAQRPVTRSFDVYFDLRLNERLSKQSWGWWFDTPLCPLWRHNNAWSPFIRPRSRYS